MEERREGRDQGRGSKEGTGAKEAGSCPGRWLKSGHRTSRERLPFCHLCPRKLHFTVVKLPVLLSLSPKIGSLQSQIFVAPPPNFIQAQPRLRTSLQVHGGMRKGISCVFTFYMERLSVTHKVKSFSSIRKGQSFK